MNEYFKGLSSPEEKETNAVAYRNYHQAVQWIDRESSQPNVCVSHDLFFELHKICMNGLLPVEETGHYRKYNVRITQAIITPPDHSRIPELMNYFVNDYKDKLQNCQENPQINRVREVIDLITWGHYVFTRIHPFEDGNGRVARLSCDFFCRKFDLRPIIWPENREVYLSALSSVDKGGNLDNLGLLMAKLIRARYNQKRNNPISQIVIGELEKIIEEKSLSVSEKSRGEGFDKIWPIFSHSSFT